MQAVAHDAGPEQGVSESPKRVGPCRPGRQQPARQQDIGRSSGGRARGSCGACVCCAGSGQSALAAQTALRAGDRSRPPHAPCVAGAGAAQAEELRADCEGRRRAAPTQSGKWRAGRGHELMLVPMAQRTSVRRLARTVREGRPGVVCSGGSLRELGEEARAGHACSPAQRRCSRV